MAPRNVKLLQNNYYINGAHFTKQEAPQTKCHQIQKSYLINESILTGYLDICTFDKKKEYIVCSTMVEG